MVHKDAGWRPDIGMETFDGDEVWDHGVGPHEVNEGEVDGTVEKIEALLDELEGLED